MKPKNTQEHVTTMFCEAAIGSRKRQLKVRKNTSQQYLTRTRSREILDIFISLGFITYGKSGWITFATDKITDKVQGVEKAADIIESNIQLNALSGIANTSSGFWFQSTSGAGVTPRLLNSGDITFQIDASYLADGSINNNTFQNLSGTSSNIQTQLNDKIVNANTRLLKGLEQYKRCFSSPFTAFANAVTTNNQAYFVFLGRTPEEKIIKNVNFTINTSGRGTQTAEVGLFSTSLPPCSSGLIFTKLVYSDGVTDMLGGSPKVCKNITGFVNNSGYLVASGIYLWAGYRVSMVTTQPNVRQISAVDNGRGFVQIQASAPRFSGNIAGWSGTIQAASVTTLGPYLSANMD